MIPNMLASLVRRFPPRRWVMLYSASTYSTGGDAMKETPGSSSAPILRFGPFELDCAAGELRKRGSRIRLQEQPFQILRLLLERGGQIVTREEIRKSLWPNDTVVEFEHSINAAVRRLRDALGDSADKPRYIQTLSRRGYCFIGQVSKADEKEVSGVSAADGQPATAADGLAGTIVSHYRVLERLGSGGMGILYKAVDLKLGREVALKLMSDERTGNAAARKCFQREVYAASALNHPNICTIYGVEEFAGRPVIAMELLEGEVLSDRLKRGPLPSAELLQVAVPIADALEAAHSRGIVHRDLKPANIFLTARGVPKLLDFGLAQANAEAAAELTRAGTPAGSLSYMSPEQARGENVDFRSDLFSFGVVLYESATGQLPSSEPVAPCGLQPELPPAIERIILRCLERDPHSRYLSTATLLQELRASDVAHIRRPWLPRPRILIPALIAFAVLLAVAAVPYYRRAVSVRWVRNVAIPEATRLATAGDEVGAFPLIYQALRILPQDPAVDRLRREYLHTIPIRTSPPGAGIYLKPYMNPDAAWLYVGDSPLENFRLPFGYFRWKVVKPGYRTVEFAAGIQEPSIEFVLDREANVPPGMAHVPAGNTRVPIFGTLAGRPGTRQLLHLGEFWIDQYEVTNRQFKKFVDSGGYRTRGYWLERFGKDGRVLSWEEAMAEFRDATGRPGPSTWEIGNYPAGRDDFPVAGVSWYEAAAYAEFAHKRLPTIFHWYRAANQRIYSDILHFSNFDGIGPERVGSRRGIGAFGTYDMAGNVKEWCWNMSGGRRYILGAAWNESRPYYVLPDALSPFDRSAANGFRCVMYPSGPPEDGLSDPVEQPTPDSAAQKSVSDSEFRLLASAYSYDRTDLKAIAEPTDDRPLYWRAQRITFDAAYDRQRVSAWLYLPRNARPPYQTIIFAPSGHSRTAAVLDEAEVKRMDFLMRGGRAVLFPIYQGTFDRRLSTPLGPNGERDLAIQQCKDLLRSIDYLETRPDIAHDRLGFFGISGGAQIGVLALAVEPRLRVGVLAETGLPYWAKPAQINEVNFAPRIHVPVLMLNGRDDFIFPQETRQLPLFRMLGSPEKDKVHVLYGTGHAGPTPQYIKNILEWFDRYLGPTGS